MRHRSTGGQVLPLSILMIIAVLIPLFALVGVGQVLAVRAGAQVAADAAALAGAQKATVATKVDALGNVYGYSVQIDPTRANKAAQAAWISDEGLLLGGTTTGFQVRVDNTVPAGAPATISVVGRVTFPDGLLAMVGLGQSQTVTVQSVAGTCGVTKWPGSAAPWCSQSAAG